MAAAEFAYQQRDLERSKKYEADHKDLSDRQTLLTAQLTLEHS